MSQSLGKGIQSLIPKKPSRISSLMKKPTRAKSWLSPDRESIFNVEIDKIKPNPHQPRRDLSRESLKELADSIREHGILQPLIVTKIERPTQRGRKVEYQLVAGERRWKAAKMADLPHVPVVIRDSSEPQKLEIALVENLQREDLNPVEEAQAFKQLHQEFHLKHAEIAQKVGKKRTTVTNSIRLLTLPLKIQQAILGNKISEGHARAILMAKPQAQTALYQKIIRNNLTVRQTEDMANKVREPKQRARGPKNPLYRKMERELQEILGHQVSITWRRDSGRLSLQFVNQKDLDRLVEYLSKF